MFQVRKVVKRKKHMMGQNVRGRKERNEKRRKDINDDEEEQITWEENRGEKKHKELTNFSV